jgi:asparagine synthetase B (glutamine-hydrolysing)
MRIEFVGENLKNNFLIASSDGINFISKHSEILKNLSNNCFLTGSYAICSKLPGGQVFLARDPIGTQKLFYSFDALGGVIYVSKNFLQLCSVVKFEDIKSVPRGGFTIVDRRDGVKHIVGAQKTKKIDFSIGHVEKVLFNGILNACVEQKRQPVVCLSGGLDSATIASMVARVSPNSVVCCATIQPLENQNSFCENSDFSRAKVIAETLSYK